MEASKECNVGMQNLSVLIGVLFRKGEIKKN